MKKRFTMTKNFPAQPKVVYSYLCLKCVFAPCKLNVELFQPVPEMFC